ncbi:unnamed protein product [Ostreobium quekettii]|uniref:peptidylprolyl isomerase n=1 Tax=Ostreobium quekettii TaxID=121088 RepID=A0A8S1J656_9CHLO|nr:unnamed protein product [Ostreobium quekettii]
MRGSTMNAITSHPQAKKEPQCPKTPATRLPACAADFWPGAAVSSHGIVLVLLPFGLLMKFVTVQKGLEDISEGLRVPGSKAFPIVMKAARGSASALDRGKDKIVASLPPNQKATGLGELDKLQNGFPILFDAIQDKDKDEIFVQQQELLNHVGNIEEAMVKGFPFEVPSEYNYLPQLKGRATLEMKVSFKDSPKGDKSGVMTLVCDGLSAPVSAGNFVDLVQKKFYNGMEIQRADGFVVQTGRPDKGDGYVGPSGEVRRIPLEIHVEGDKEPIYELTLEDIGRFNEQPLLPFNAYGTMAMARSEFENNSASSQVFFLLKESELTPSSANLLDGRYAVFGYIVEGQDYLGEMHVGDKIDYIKVLDGAQFLQPGSGQAPQAEPEA